MQSQGLDCKPEEVANLRGDEARAGFINIFKEVQRLKTQLDQYTDLGEEERQKIEALLPKTICVPSARSIWKQQSSSRKSGTRGVQTFQAR